MLIVFILIHVSTLIIGSACNRLPYSVTLLNLVIAITIIFYWTQKQMRIEQHSIEWREISVLLFELFVIGSGVYSVINKHWNNWFRAIQYIVFGIHLSALVLLLLGMFLFKIKRLI